ncbi:MAG: tyrosine-type recombinase/integrase [Acidobacteriaceae bacterium]
MLEHYLDSPITRRRLRSGPAADHINDFADWLHTGGYRRPIIVRRLRSLACWTDWLTATGDNLDLPEALERYAAYIGAPPRKPYRRSLNKEPVIAGKLYIQFLREREFLPPAPAAVVNSCPLLTEAYDWMREQRGLTEATLDTYRRVLEELLTSLGSDTRSYQAEALRTFVVARGKRHGVSYAKLGATAVRTFVRFLAATGRCSAGLEYAIPMWRSWVFSSTPKYLSPEDVDRVIGASADSRSGIRDTAMILLLARLGLRAGDIAGLHMTHIDWKNARILVSGKSKRQEYLPLSQEVGTALLQYLRTSRPAVRIAELFVTASPPFRRIKRQSVAGVVRRAIFRAGVSSPGHGAHVLRHSAATTMLRQGVSLAGIGAVLRHRLPSTTAHYAKVDLQSLVAVAQPWPEVTSC